jgi:circadian clock protein KaiB
MRGASPQRLWLRLYVAGDAPNSVAARINLDAILAEHGVRDARVEVIDLVRDPQRGLGDAVIVTPTLVRVAPPPERRVVGSLRDAAVVWTTLDPGAARG